MKQLLALAAIIKNEEEMLDRMLTSCGDIPKYIVDTGSTDGTWDIYKKHGVNVRKFSRYDECLGTSPQFHFSDARNESIEFADAEWLLILDGDEFLMDGVLDEIKKLLPTLDKYNAISLDVITNEETVNSPRVLRKIPEIRYTEAAHNRLRYIETNRDKMYVTKLKIRSELSPNHMRDRDRTLRILDENIRKEPKNERYWYYLAREFMSRIMKKNDKGEPVIDIAMIWTAIGSLETYLLMSQISNEKADAHYILGTLYYQIGKEYNNDELFYKAIDHMHKSLALVPSNRNAFEFLYHIYPPEFKSWFKKLTGLADNKHVMMVR